MNHTTHAGPSTDGSSSPLPIPVTDIVIAVLTLLLALAAVVVAVAHFIGLALAANNYRTWSPHKAASNSQVHPTRHRTLSIRSKLPLMFLQSWHQLCCSWRPKTRLRTHTCSVLSPSTVGSIHTWSTRARHPCVCRSS